MSEEDKTVNPTSAEGAQELSSPWGKSRKFTVIIIVLFFLIGTIQALTGSRGFVTTEINDQYLGVDGTYGDPVFLELTTISDVRLEETFDFGTCIEGEETKNTVSGTYSNDEFDSYTVHAYLKEPCIILHHPNGVLVFNCGSDSHTEDMYEQLSEAVAKN